MANLIAKKNQISHHFLMLSLLSNTAQLDIFITGIDNKYDTVEMASLAPLKDITKSPDL